MILFWWKDTKKKIDISELRLSYNCLCLLRKEYNKRRLLK
jgi:hypothetical protein